MHSSMERPSRESSLTMRASSCNRLIKNCIICWNYLYLTRQVEAARILEERKGPSRGSRYRAPPLAEPDVRALAHPVPLLAGSH